MQKNIILLAVTQLLFLGYTIAHSSDGVLYGTTLNASEPWSKYDFVAINLTTGNNSFVCTIEELYEAEQFDYGKSAIDVKNGLYYLTIYGVDRPFLFVVDFIRGVTLAPIDLFVTDLYGFAVRPTTGELFVVVEWLNSTYLSQKIYVVSSENVRSFSLPNSNYSTIATTFNDDDFYIVLEEDGDRNVNLLFIDPDSGEIERQVQVSNSNGTYFGRYMEYDSTDNVLYIGGENNWARINAQTGDCSFYSVKNYDYAGLWSYVPNTRTMWFDAEMNNKVYVVSLNVDTNEIVTAFPMTSNINFLNIGIDPGFT